MSKKITIKPVHLVLVGLIIIILGILIPSFFIDAFSTIGFAVIIGSLILLSAYMFFAINLVKSKGKKTIKWLALPVFLALLVGGGFYANNKHNEYLASKIYSVGDTIKISTFTFKITDVAWEALPFKTDGLDLSTVDCEIIDYRPTFTNNGTVYSPSNPHRFWGESACHDYNSYREKAKKYVADYNGRLAISYGVTASDTVHGKDLQITLLPDSGRKVNFNAGSGTGDWQYSFMWGLGVKDYIANPASDFGGDLSKGLTRKGTVALDLQKTEQVVDVIVKYGGETRTIRIDRNE